MGSSLRCCNSGSCIGIPGKSLPHFWEENQAWLVGCLSGGPCVFCVVLLSVLLSVSHQCLCPFNPCSSFNTQSLSRLLPAPSDPPKGTAPKALPCCPCPLLPHGPRPLPCPSHFGIPTPAPSSLQLLSPGSGLWAPGIHSRLSSFPVPHPGLQRAAGGKPPGLCSLCLKSPG